MAHIEKLAKSGAIRSYKVVGSKSGENGKKGQKNKFNARKIEVDGVKFDSKKEYCRFMELQLLEKMGEVTYLTRQVKFVLSVCTYIADFTYYDKSGHYTVEDVKSSHTRKLPVYRLKNKLMKKERNITIKES